MTEERKRPAAYLEKRRLVKEDAGLLLAAMLTMKILSEAAGIVDKDGNVRAVPEQISNVLEDAQERLILLSELSTEQASFRE